MDKIYKKSRAVKQLEATQKQRFGLRKLSVGVASVLLGTTFLFGTSNIAHADDTNDSVETSEKNDHQLSTEQTHVLTKTQQETPAESQDSSSVPVKQSITDSRTVKDLAVSSVGGEQHSSLDAHTKDRGEDEEKSSDTQVFKSSDHQLPVTKQSLGENKTANESINKATNLGYIVNGEVKSTITVDTGNPLNFNFQTNDYVAGDKFTFKIHPAANQDGIDITGTYQVTPANDKPNQAEVDVPAKQGDNEYEFTDTMKSAGTYSQVISIGTSNAFKPGKLYKDGTYDIIIDVYKNGTPFKSSSFKQTVNHFEQLWWGGHNSVSSNSLEALYTMDGSWVSSGIIVSGVDYQWKLNPHINPSYNHGTTITIPVPDHFELNQAQTQAKNQEWLSKYHASITQTGNVVTVTFPQLTNDQLQQMNLSDTDYNYLTVPIIGKINQQPVDNTTVSGSDQTKLVGDLGGTQNKTDQVSPIKATLLGTNNIISRTPIGDLLNVNIDPDKKNEMHQYYPDQPDNITTKEDSAQGIHALNKKVMLSSTSPELLKDIDATIIVPDGMNISSISTASNSDQNPVFQYEYLDGSKSAAFTQDHILTAPAGKFIKRIRVHFDQADPYAQLFDLNLMGVLADQYRGDHDDSASKNADKTQPSAGDPVSNLDALTTKVSVALSDSQINQVHHPFQWSDGQVVLDKNPDTTIYRNHLSASGSQYSHQAGEQYNVASRKGGYIRIDQTNFQDQTPDVTYYVVLPENAALNAEHPFKNLPAGAQVSYLNINGRSIVKVHVQNEDRDKLRNTDFQLNLDNASVITNKTLQSDYAIYAVVPKAEKLYTYAPYTSPISPVSTDQDLAFVENNQNAYRLSGGNWTLVTSVVTQTTTQAAGNQSATLASQGTSDDKGSAEMRFSSSIVNGEAAPLKNVTTILRMPNTKDGKSQFNFKLTKPVKIINKNNGQEVTSGVRVFYTTNSAYQDKAMEQISTTDWQNDFSTTVPTDLTKVTAIAVKIDSVPEQAFYQIITEGIDPTLATDAGKTAYVANKIWSDTLLPKNINSGKTASTAEPSISAKVNVVGQSTVHIKLHYRDAAGHDQYVDAGSIKLTDNQDKLTKDAVLQNAFGIDDATLQKAGLSSDELNKLNDNPSFRAQLVAKYPALKDYAVDFTSPSDPSQDPANKDQHQYANGAPDKAAAWNQTAQYYFDGDQVVFELQKLQDTSQTVKLSRKVKYVSLLDDHELKNPDIRSNFKSLDIHAIYDPLTQTVIPIDEIKDQTFDYHNNKEGSINPATNIKGYAINKYDYQSILSNVPGIHQLNGVLQRYRNKLFGQHEHGLQIDLYDTADFSHLDDQITEKADIPAGTISIVYHQVAHYIPSHANLITMVPGQQNQLVKIANNVDESGEPSDQINFGITDDQLAKPGYKYKVYYVGSSYDDEVNSTITQNDYQYLPTGWAESTGTAYDTLAAALREHKYDDQWDDIDSPTKDEHNNGQVADARLNTQNFVVVYTPTEQRPQEIYITSDNDPYAYNKVLKDYAMPKTILSDKVQQQRLIDQLQAELQAPNVADPASVQHLLDLAKAGKFEYLYKLSGQDGQLPLTTEAQQAITSDKNLPSGDPTDPDTGEVTAPLYPHFNPSDMEMMNAVTQSGLYERNGYYIQRITLSAKDGSGKRIVLEHTFDPDQASGSTDSYSNGDNQLLAIVNYLTTKVNDGTENAFQLASTDSSAWQIKVTGLDNSKVVTGDDGNQYLIISNGDRFAFNDTDYDAAKESDPNPQIINFHYEPIVPRNPENQQNKVTIHYIDVTGVDPLDPSTTKDEYGFSFKYSQQANAGTELTDIPGFDDNQVGVPAPISDQMTFDNTANDHQILEALAKKGYYVVQRDHETTGEQHFDMYASDYSTGEYNGNYGAYYSGGVSEQNYYVYLQKGKPINYQVILEDKNGQQKQVLVKPTLLGYGSATDKVATTPSGQDHSTSTTTIGDQYQAIEQALQKQYPNYILVTKDNPNTKLKQSDEIMADETFGEGDTVTTKTIYMVPKYGNVTVHYIDVDAKARAGQTSFTKDDGTEVHQQTPAENLQFGDEYSNTTWDYAGNHYELATKHLPAGVTSGTVNADQQDIYVYLKHDRNKPLTDKTTPIHVTETIHYVDEDGKPVADQNGKTSTTGRNKLTLNPVGYYDQVAGHNVITGWSTPAGTQFDSVEIPEFTDYFVIAAHHTSQLGTQVNDFDQDHHQVKAVSYDPAQVPTSTTQDQNVDVYVVLKQKHSKLVNNQPMTVTETVRYVDEDGQSIKPDDQATMTLTPQGYHDNQTDKDVITNWQSSLPHSEFPTYDARVDGYDIDMDKTKAADVSDDHTQVNSVKVTVKHNQQPANVEITIHYQKQLATNIHYVDVNGSDKTADFTPKDGQLIDRDSHKVTERGHAGDKFKNALWKYDSAKWELVAQDPEVVAGKLTKGIPTDLYVYLKHKTHPISDTKTITETVHYVATDGSKVPADHQAKVNFSRDGYHDNVTNVDHWNDWKPGETQTFEEVPTPEKKGYTPDVKTVSTITVKPTDKNINKTITYTPDGQKLDVVFIDDTIGKILKTVNKTGVTNADAGYNTKSDIQHYEGQHYILVSDSSNGTNLKFDNDASVDQHYEVHLKHGTQTSEQDVQVPRTINYVYQDGRQAKPDHHDALSYHETKVVDLVDGHTISAVWTPAQDFATITTPVIPGFTPDRTEVANTGIEHDHPAIVERVTYSPDAQKITVNYIDDVTGKTLETKSLTGVSDQVTDYTTKSTIDSYVEQHYKLISDETNGDNLVFDHDDNVDQVYNVHLTHTYQQVSDTTTVKETIHYQYSDGSLAAADYHGAAIEFKRIGIKDLVTNQINWNPWQPDNDSFVAVKSPQIDGYHVDRTVVDRQIVTPTSEDIDIVVTYYPDDNNTVYPDKQVNKHVTNDYVGKSDNDNTHSYSSKPVNYDTANGQKQPATSIKRNAQQLPQTGNSKNSRSILGVALASLAGFIGLAGTKKKRD